ncbi:MAG: hypothetical protein EI684_21535 [Candidatus Viridilinea halotolerans]|uniref:Fibronectin type-III domain-containing protein n=1 Tax=Candidatus Viridilinea halotolerans TaxID=2491704 RepID=A0A426TRC3_9CHLR|nr:MAG: hypothetical protein EI684_21535 [Candidatus Viridilinea halotolerans]
MPNQPLHIKRGLLTLTIMVSLLWSGSLLWLGGHPPAVQAQDAASLAQQVVELTNIERAARGLSPLKLQGSLHDAAMWIVQDSASNNYFGHTDSLGRGIDQRYTDFGYTSYNLINENIHVGSSSIDDMFSSIINYDDTRNNMFRSGHCEMGAGYNYNVNSTYQHYWSQAFGCRSGVYPLIINLEAATTHNPVVDLYIYGTGWAQEMRLSNDGANWSAWESYRSTRTWMLASGTGWRAVYVQLRNGTTIRSAWDTIQLTSPPPSAPTDLVVSSVGIGSVSLTWQDNAHNEAGFRIYKWGYGADEWEFYPLATVGANVTAFTEYGLACESDYYYLVVAYNNAGESARTPWVQATTLGCPQATLTPTATHTPLPLPTATHTPLPVATATTVVLPSAIPTAARVNPGVWNVFLPLVIKSLPPPPATPTATSMPSTVTPTVPSGTLPTNWLARVNAYRAIAGVPPVTEDATLNNNCWQHARYMAENRDITHDQNPSLPWASAAGQICAQKGNAWMDPGGSRQPYQAIDGWMTSVGHRLWLLYPTTPTFGFGFYTNGQWGGAALDILSRANMAADAAYTGWPIRYPAPNQSQVPPIKMPITLQWPYFDEAPILTGSQLRTSDGRSLRYGVTTNLPVGHKGIALTPTDNLPAGAVIEVEVVGSYKGQPFHFTWSFVTAQSNTIFQAQDVNAAQFYSAPQWSR